MTHPGGEAGLLSEVCSATPVVLFSLGAGYGEYLLLSVPLRLSFSGQILRRRGKQTGCQLSSTAYDGVGKFA